MALASFDYYAYHGTNIVSRASVWSKLLLIVVVLIGIVASNDPQFLLCWYVLTLLALSTATDLPFFELFLAALYPLIFTVIFTVGFYGLNVGVFLILACKVLAASTTMILVLSTTPYPALFRALGFVITPMLSSILLLTYRSFFLLIETFTESYAMVRLRGGVRLMHPVRALRNLANIVGLTLIRAIELSEVQYESMRLRGFKGAMYYTARSKSLPSATIALLCFEVVLLGLFVISKAHL